MRSILLPLRDNSAPARCPISPPTLTPGVRGSQERVYPGSWVEGLNRAGFSVAGFDMQSHGWSQGARGLHVFCEEFDHLCDDLRRFAELISAAHGSERAGAAEERAPQRNAPQRTGRRALRLETHASKRMQRVASFLFVRGFCMQRFALRSAAAWFSIRSLHFTSARSSSEAGSG